jgi:hypothetical protein
MQYFDIQARFVSLDPSGILFGSPIYRTRKEPNSNVLGKLFELDIQSKIQPGSEQKLWH